MIILLVAALIFHTWAIKQVVRVSLQWGLGAPVTIEKVKMDWKITGFEVHNLEIGNPYHYPPGLLADIPLAIISVDISKLPVGILKFKTVGFKLRELVVMHAPGQGINVMELKPLKKNTGGRREGERTDPKEKKSSGGPRIRIDEFILSVDTITFSESVGTMKKHKKINANIAGASFYNLQGADDLAYIVASLAMRKLGFAFFDDRLQRFFGDQEIPASKSGFFDKIKSILG